MLDFQRARSEEQRTARRQAILRTATQMLAEMPVADLSLNELSRRVGLAKSNVLRYFESREAVLIELLDIAWRDFLAELERQLAIVDLATAVDARRDQIARIAADTIVAAPLLGELVSVSAGVLEHNISVDIARSYKRASIANTRRLAELVRDRLPELSAAGAEGFAAAAAVATMGLWPLTHPGHAMLCVYEDPALAVMRIDFGTALFEVFATMLAGCLVRRPSTE